MRAGPSQPGHSPHMPPPTPPPTPRHVPSGLSSSHRTVPLPASLRGREGSRQRARRARPVGAALGAEGGSEEGPALPTLRDNPSWCRRLAVIFKISFPQSGEKSSFCLCLSPSSPRALGGVTGGGGLEDEGPGQCACGGVRLLRTLAPPSGADPPAGPPPPGAAPPRGSSASHTAGVLRAPTTRWSPAGRGLRVPTFRDAVSSGETLALSQGPGGAPGRGPGEGRAWPGPRAKALE